jgi:putative peptidoglycan lipid II flippase
MAVTEINILVDTFLASFLVEGSITALRLANRLMLLPMGIFGVAIATALLPVLSSRAAAGDREGVTGSFTDAQDLVFFIMLPISAMFILLAEPIIRLVYEHGNFTSSSSTPLTVFALICYSTGLFAYAGLKVTVQAFYSLKDTRTPVKVATLAMGINIVLNIALMLGFEKVKPGFGLGGLATATAFSVGLGGLATATAFSAAINLGILMVLLRKQLDSLSLLRQGIAFIKMVVLGLLTGLVSLGVYKLVGSVVKADHLTGQILHVASALLAGGAVWVLCAYLLKIKQLKMLFSAFKR